MASTVLLSAVVIAAVGWLLLQQTRDGLLEHRVDGGHRPRSPTRCEEADERLEDASGHGRRRRPCSGATSPT